MVLWGWHYVLWCRQGWGGLSLSKVYLWKSQVEGYLPRLPAPGDLIKLLTFRGQKALPFSTCSVNQFTWIPTILRNFAISTGQSCLNWSTVLSTCKVKRSPALHLPVCSPPSCLLAVYISRDSVQETDKYTEFTNIARCSASLNFILWQGSWLHSR